MSTRRELMALGAATALSACGASRSPSAYDRLAETIRKPLGPQPDLLELVRFAALAGNGHNTQAWRFAVAPSRVSILPDFSRRTPVVDPDDHHLFVSLGCAAENLVQAAESTGRPAKVAFVEEGEGRLDIDLGSSRSSPANLFQAIPLRQCTRSEYSGASVPLADIKRLETAAAADGVSVFILTDRSKLGTVRDFVVQGNSRQMEDAAFRAELKRWIRFNDTDAITKRDGLFTAASGNPQLPTWAGDAIFPFVFTEKSENDTYARQMASSSGVAVFVGDKADHAHWIKVGRSVQRFALQIAALGMTYAVINQPVEVASVRRAFAGWLGIDKARPDFVLRFGYAKTNRGLPKSLRRPVTDIVIQG
ncbi:Acg family FMN-binding oxidoreductase [Asticcacaulis sp. 201]|uniref:Acg family FMN-binding oxidoreductase n=1 Tax=Asticcacaulis sp. 201 TaxID=3028787 RepID=UPI0029164ED9|nr:Tat pathway signal protein [Asticcacaulis sp. 201]MDV6330920.1 Tat pathway signal protein [Asticcacaulis sp. 201]